MGHKRIDETMLYVHVAEAHAPPMKPATESWTVIAALLGARGKTVAKPRAQKRKRQPSQLPSSCARGDSNPHTVKY